MRKFLTIAIPIVTIVLFVLIMLSGELLKRPIGNDYDIPDAIQNLMEDVQAEDWNEVEKKTNHLESMWKKIVTRVQFSSERDEINYFSMNIARLRGATMAHDKSGALTSLSEAFEHWDELGN